MFTINDSLAAMRGGGGGMWNGLSGTMREPRVSQNYRLISRVSQCCFFSTYVRRATSIFFHKAVQGSQVFTGVRNSRSTDLFVYIY